jgi:hypothetical protein
VNVYIEMDKVFQERFMATAVQAAKEIAMTDRNVEAVRQLLLDRSEVGIKKYGTTTDRDDLSLLQWLNHALMESLDQCVYLKRAITKLEEETRDKGEVQGNA